VQIDLSDGARLPLTGAKPFLTLRDGRPENFFRGFVKHSSVVFGEVPVFSNSNDDYIIMAAADGHKDAGIFPMHVETGGTHKVSLMMVRKDAEIEFGGLTLPQLSTGDPELFTFLGGNTAGGASRFGEMLAAQPEAMTCLFNIAAATRRIPISLDQPDRSLQSFLKEIDLKLVDKLGATTFSGVRRDRIYAWADPGLLNVIEAHADGQGQALFTTADASLHGVAGEDKISFKEIRFDVANLQYTFFKDRTKQVNGQNLMLMDIDMDLFKDQGAHFFLEVIPNHAGKLFQGDKATTDPRKIYALRWMAGQNARNTEDFTPPYTLEKG